MAFVQAASGLTTASATTATTSAPITVTAGHTIVVWGCISTSGNPFGSFTSSQGDTFSSIVSFATSGNQTVNAAIITSAVGGSTSFTIHTTGVNSNLMYIGVAEFSGRVGTFEKVGNAFLTPFVSTHSSPTTPNPVQAGDDLVALICDVVGPVGHVETFTATGAWTATAVQNGNGTTGDLPLGMIMYQNNVAAGNYTATYTTFTNVQSANVILGLPAVSGANLPASYGPFAITGSAANLAASTVQPLLLAFPGTYNLSGAPASSDFQIFADSGAYFYFGSPASLSVVLPSQTLVAGSGAYSMAAQDVSFSIGVVPPAPPAIPPGPVLPVVFRVTTRQFNLLEMVEREWGASFKEPDHRVYSFGGGKRFFDSTDTGFTGIYGPVMSEEE